MTRLEKQLILAHGFKKDKLDDCWDFLLLNLERRWYLKTASASHGPMYHNETLSMH